MQQGQVKTVWFKLWILSSTIPLYTNHQIITKLMNQIIKSYHFPSLTKQLSKKQNYHNFSLLYIIKNQSLFTIIKIKMQNQPNPRFNDYIEIIKNNEVVGFKLDNNDFQFLFDKYGGWYDEDGKYYNAQAVECPKPEDQSDDDDEEEQDTQGKLQKCQGKDVLGKLEECLIGLNVTDQNQRLQTVRNLTQIIQSYPSNEEIIIILTLQPPQPNQDQVIEKYLKEKLDRQLKVQKGEVIGVFDQQLALSIAQLEGTYINDIKATIYVDVELFDCLKISTLMRKSELQTILNEHRFKKNIDYANIEEEKNQKGEYECWLEINADIEDQLRDFVDFVVEEE